MRLNQRFVPLLAVAAIMLLVTCKKEAKEAANVPIDNPVIRLVYFDSQNFDGDPAKAPNPHLVKMAESADGINFGDAKTIFSYDNLVDPDIFKIGTGQYGLMVTDFGASKSVLATSTTVDGTYVLSGINNKPNVTQTATIKYNGVLKSLSSGISIHDFDVSAKSFTNTKLLITTSAVNQSTGIVADPSIAKMADGKYILIFKYQPAGGSLSNHQTWMITSADPTNFTGKATLVRDKASVPCVVRVGSKLYLYFVDASGGGQTKLGMGVSSDNGATWTFAATTLNGQEFTRAVDPAAFPVDETNLD